MREVIRESLPEEVKRSLRACWKEGVLAQVVSGIFDYYLIPYSLFLGATPSQIGFLVASPSLLSALAQIFAVKAVHAAGTRRELLVWGVGVQIVTLVPLAFLPFVHISGKITALIILISAFRVMGSLMGPAWGSLVSDYLPEGQRGQYLGWRSRVVSLAGVSNLAFCGIVLSLSRRVSQNAGFMVLFILAALFRIFSFRFMVRMVDVPVHPAPSERLAVRNLVRRLRRSNMVKFVAYAAAVTFATQLAAPYFSVYMLKDLGFGYAAYTCVQLASVVAGLVAYPIWGRHADRVGNAKIMQSASWLVPLVPFLWAFARGPVSLVLIEGFSGFVWSGFTLASSNFIYDGVAPALRVQALAYYNLINGAAVFLGASLGGWMAEHLAPFLGHALLTLFLISAALRLAAHFVLSSRFKEVRSSVQHVAGAHLFLSVLGVRPLAGENVEPPLYPPLRPPRRRIWGSLPARKEGPVSS